MSEYLHERHFSLEEARKALHSTITIVDEIAEIKRKLDEQGYDIHRHQYFGGSGPNGERFFPAELEALVESIRKLEKVGIILKGIDQGLIDFPHIRSNGQEVYLCWMRGERDIEFWHSIADGFAGRRPVQEL